jgi:hypothetical protein
MDSFIKIFTKIIMQKIKIPFAEYNLGIDPKLLKSNLENRIDIFAEVEEFILTNN